MRKLSLLSEATSTVNNQMREREREEYDSVDGLWCPSDGIHLTADRLETNGLVNDKGVRSLANLMEVGF